MVNYIKDPKANILKNIMRDPSEMDNVLQFRELPPPSTKNMCQLRAMMAIAEFTDLLKLYSEELGIKLINQSMYEFSTLYICKR
jgi:hypothetical protein